MRYFFPSILSWITLQDEKINRAGSSGASRENGSAPREDRRMSANLAGRQDISLETVANERSKRVYRLLRVCNCLWRRQKMSRRPIMRSSREIVHPFAFIYIRHMLNVYFQSLREKIELKGSSTRVLYPKGNPIFRVYWHIYEMYHCECNKFRYRFFAIF